MPASLASAVIDLHAQRRIDLVKLGPRPSWYFPFARRRWDREREALGKRYLANAKRLAMLNGNTSADFMLALEYVWT
jgi:hypothetical protein